MVSVKAEDKPLTAYNLTVSDFHTYFVSGSNASNLDAASVWVHNNCIPRLNQALRTKMHRIRNQTAAGGEKGVAGKLSALDAEKLGKNFVGEGYRVSATSQGTKLLISKDGLRQFRYPAPKGGINNVTGQPWSRTGLQVNFETRKIPDGKWLSNVHLDIGI